MRTGSRRCDRGNPLDERTGNRLGRGAGATRCNSPGRSTVPGPERHAGLPGHSGWEATPPAPLHYGNTSPHVVRIFSVRPFPYLSREHPDRPDRGTGNGPHGPQRPQRRHRLPWLPDVLKRRLRPWGRRHRRDLRSAGHQAGAPGRLRRRIGVCMCAASPDCRAPQCPARTAAIAAPLSSGGCGGANRTARPGRRAQRLELRCFRRSRLTRKWQAISASLPICRSTSTNSDLHAP